MELSNFPIEIEIQTSFSYTMICQVSIEECSNCFNIFTSFYRVFHRTGNCTLAWMMLTLSAPQLKSSSFNFSIKHGNILTCQTISLNFSTMTELNHKTTEYFCHLKRKCLFTLTLNEKFRFFFACVGNQQIIVEFSKQKYANYSRIFKTKIRCLYTW